MPKPPIERRTKTEKLRDHRLLDLLHAYADRRAPEHSAAWQAHMNASQEVDDLAFHQPEFFWRFLELAVGSDIFLDDLENIGWGPLTWLLRLHPDDWIDRVAGLASRSQRMKALAAGVDQDRVAPDVWRRLQAAESRV